MSELNNNDNDNSSGNADDILCCGQQPKRKRMMMEIQAYNICANGAKNTMSPPKHQKSKSKSKRPEQLYVPDVVVVHPAASSKHHADDATVKTMHSRLTNLSDNEGETNCNKFEGQPVAKYFGKERFFGLVEAHFWDSNSGKNLYFVKYDAGDGEDVSESTKACVI